MKQSLIHQIQKLKDEKRELAKELKRVKIANAQNECKRAHLSARVDIFDRELKKGKKARLYAKVTLVFDVNGVPALEIPFIVLENKRGNRFITDPNYSGVVNEQGYNMYKCECGRKFELKNVIKTPSVFHPYVLSLVAMKEADLKKERVRSTT